MRTVRLGLANAFWCLGSVVGLLLSGILFQSGGEILAFSAALALEVLAFAVSVWRVRVFGVTRCCCSPQNNEIF
jgi:fucose permease